ncbi:putative proline-rich protein 4 [Cocos nucifera]|uniref:Putative proline-rich protein 4 n=1 Tax=Cocos nucifera TaxID=13894 RepID=A0A8K0IEG7_COCNU|nr:putative proline-rich protein 4 [Cocos nucifera]
MASIKGSPPLLRSLLLGLCTVLLASNFSSATPQTERIVAVVGDSECLDCAQKSIKNEEAFKDKVSVIFGAFLQAGLHVAIQCKTGNGSNETKGVGLLDKSGSFDVQLPSGILRDDGELKDECFAQLRGTSEAPCPDNNGVDQSKIVLKSKESGKHTFVLAAGKLSFSSTCTTAFACPPCPPPCPPCPPPCPPPKKPCPPAPKKPCPPVPKKSCSPCPPPCPPAPKKPCPPAPKKPCPPAPKKPRPQAMPAGSQEAVPAMPSTMPASMPPTMPAAVPTAMPASQVATPTGFKEAIPAGSQVATSSNSKATSLGTNISPCTVLTPSSSSFPSARNNFL